MSAPLPPGQRDIGFFPRFGVPDFAAFIPAGEVSLQLGGNLSRPTTLRLADLQKLPRREVQADFHCVATWSYRGLRWEGWSLKDVYDTFVAPLAPAGATDSYLELRAQDGYRVSLLLADALVPEVLLADRLNGEPLSTEHGAPLRLVAPALYGYKNVKHLSAINLRSDYEVGLVERNTRAHPRGRVAFEERGRGLPGWLYRILYRALFRPTLWRYQRIARAAAERAHRRKG